MTAQRAGSGTGDPHAGGPAATASTPDDAPVGPQVDVWWATVEDADERLARVLDHDERDRLQRFHREQDRARFLVGAVLARAVIGGLTGGSSAGVEVDRRCEDCGRAHGRPRAVHPGLAVRHSVSHAGDVVVVAVTRAADFELGADVEAVHGATVPERAVLRPEDHAAGVDAWRAWVSKEACLKATGEGLRRDPLEVRLAGTVARIGEKGPWLTVEPLPAPSGYVAALALLHHSGDDDVPAHPQVEHRDGSAAVRSVLEEIRCPV